MRKIISFFIGCFFVSFTNFAQEDIVTSVDEIESEVVLNWSENYKKALKQSKKENKPILIYFTGSDWCGPCQVLDRDLFHTEKFKAFSEKSLVLLEVDLPRRVDLLPTNKLKENYYLKSKYNVTSFPTLIVINDKEKIIGQRKGVILTEYYYPFFESVINKY
ncbi:thioredoxin family protein [uncultured Polaribacter sp.]|uniref:thioredoxin family protein n=1 Tax=uncultured Polaribacter sp. TaxID=174711 RepID=UPI0026193F1F|nr:thioredoxin family protein [uncultured Polaribacter sp.]